jgi:hypothetical protein
VWSADRRVQIGVGVFALLILIAAARVGFASPSPPVATPSPTPTLQAGFWRIEGTVVDDKGKPVSGVCVGVGPAVCTDVNPRTDEQGRWHIDVPQVTVDYDFHFTKRFACLQEDKRIHPTGSISFQMTLRCPLTPPPSP